MDILYVNLPEETQREKNYINVHIKKYIEKDVWMVGTNIAHSRERNVEQLEGKQKGKTM